MKLYKFSIIILWILQCSTLTSQTTNHSDNISTHIELISDTLLVGEPSFVYFFLTNNGKESIFIESGDEHLYGRNSSFKIEVITPKKDTLVMPKLRGGGGISVAISYREIKPNERKKFKVFLPMWRQIQKKGDYQLNISKIFKIVSKSTTPPYTDSLSEIVKVQTSIALPVLKDHNKLGAFIENMVKEIKEETQGRIIEGLGFRIGETMNYYEMSRQLAGYLKIIEELDDERIVPFFVECYKEGKHFSKYGAIRNLAKYPNNLAALEIMQSVFTSPINLERSAKGIRPIALRAIMNSTQVSAFDFLLSKKNDQYAHDGMAILKQATKQMSMAKRKKIFTAFLDHKNELVAKKAKEALVKMKLE